MKVIDIEGGGWFPEEDVEITVSLVEEGGREQPPVISVSFHYKGKNEEELSFRRPPPFAEYISNNANQTRVAVVPKGEVKYEIIRDQQDEVCWIATNSADVLDGGVTVLTSPNEKMRKEYLVLGTSNERCPPSGKYNFSDNFGHSDRSSKEEWGFSIIIR